jgi:YfiH family protein
MMSDSNSSFLKLEWPAPKSIGAAISLRNGGVSELPYKSNNMGLNVGDDPIRVNENRDALESCLNLENSPIWLDQVHGTDIIYAPDAKINQQSDGSFSDIKGLVCIVMTADCLPILICNKAGTEVAAVHAGWRGLCNGVVRNALDYFSGFNSDLLAYLGPAIGASAYEVGPEVLAQFRSMAQSDDHSQQITAAFTSSVGDSQSDRLQANLYSLAIAELNACDVSDIYGGDCCTFSEPERFYSYRRDGITGRHASLIWIK